MPCALCLVSVKKTKTFHRPLPQLPASLLRSLTARRRIKEDHLNTNARARLTRSRRWRSLSKLSIAPKRPARSRRVCCTVMPLCRGKHFAGGANKPRHGIALICAICLLRLASCRKATHFELHLACFQLRDLGTTSDSRCCALWPQMQKQLYLPARSFPEALQFLRSHYPNRSSCRSGSNFNWA